MFDVSAMLGSTCFVTKGQRDSTNFTHLYEGAAQENVGYGADKLCADRGVKAELVDSLGKLIPGQIFAGTPLADGERDHK